MLEQLCEYNLVGLIRFQQSLPSYQTGTKQRKSDEEMGAVGYQGYNTHGRKDKKNLIYCKELTMNFAAVAMLRAGVTMDVFISSVL